MIRAAAYVRKSNDQGERDEEAKSVARQLDGCRQFATERGWLLADEHVYSDDGVSGAEWKDRHGLNRLLATLDAPTPPFTVLLIEDQTRLGRDAARVPMLVNQIEEAGIEIWSTHDRKRVSMADFSDEVQTVFSSLAAAYQRRKASDTVATSHRRSVARGLVAGGKVYGYTNIRNTGGVRRVVDEAQAATVQRIFTETSKSTGLMKIAKQLNAEGVAGPRGVWSPTGVREVLHRELYRGVVVYGRTKRGRKRGTKTRSRTEEANWLRHEAPELRIISDALWQAAHATKSARAGAWLRRNGKLHGQVESFRGKHLLSGFLACGVCGAQMIATQRGRNLAGFYVCSAHKVKGDAVCANTTGVPMARLHNAVIMSLRDTLSPENFERLLQAKAEDVEARAAAQAERASLIESLPKLAAAEQRLVRRIGLVEDDALVAGLKEEWAKAKAERESAERRITQIEGMERDYRAESDAVERLRAAWADWGGALTAEPALARQLLRKCLEGPITVTPRSEIKGWVYEGRGRFDDLLHGAVGQDGTAVVHEGFPEHRPPVTVRAWTPSPEIAVGARPIAGGSYDAAVLAPSGPPTSINEPSGPPT